MRTINKKEKKNVEIKGKTKERLFSKNEKMKKK